MTKSTKILFGYGDVYDFIRNSEVKLREYIYAEPICLFIYATSKL